MDTNSQPQVSIILSVHNGESTLENCLKSIVRQTYKNYELIVINDASTDNTQKILETWFSSLYEGEVAPKAGGMWNNPTNLGLTKSLNIGTNQATGKYIARIDADDMWHPEKLAKQMSFLHDNPKIGLLGTFYKNNDKTIILPTSDPDIKKYIWRRNPFGHSCVVIKKDLLEKTEGYDEKLKYAQDRDLWFRLMPYTKFANLPEVLVNREVSHISNDKQNIQMRTNITMIKKYAKLYHASPTAYLGLIEPYLVLNTPYWIRDIKRQQLVV